jgi:hypothetical protein
MEIFTYKPFRHSGDEHEIDLANLENLYKKLGRDADAAALQGSRVYGNPRWNSDLDGLEIYDELDSFRYTFYKNIKFDGFKFSLLQSSFEVVHQDLERGKYGNYLASRLCRFSKIVRNEKIFLKLEEMALNKFLKLGLGKLLGIEEITPSFAMKVICKERLWREPKRWWSISRSFLKGKNRQRNIDIYYEKVEKAMNESNFLSRKNETYEDENVYAVRGLKRNLANKIQKIKDLYNFAKTQILASNPLSIMQEAYPVIHAICLAHLEGRKKWPEFFEYEKP